MENMNQKPVKFHQLRSEKVLTTFHIKKRKNCEELKELLSGQSTLTMVEDAILDMALERYDQIGDGWNEEELKMHFISPIFSVANVNISDVCKTFFERPLSGIIDNYELNVITDCMVAGYDEGGNPTKPYFFLQEFKQSQRFGKTDPQGQMLAAMLLAAAAHDLQDDDNQYLYGCYVIERFWFFTTLKGSDYCVSPAYDATKKPDLLQIVYILRNLKALIARRTVLERNS